MTTLSERSGHRGSPPQYRGSPPQFGLRDMLYFTFVCSACASTIATMPLTLGSEMPRRAALAIVITWLVLAVVYLRQHLPDVFLVHWVGFGVAVVVTLGTLVAPSNLGVLVIRVVTLGCFLGTLLSSLAYVLRIVYFSLARARARRVN